MVVLNAETRSLKRAAIAMKQVVGLSVSENTIERVCWEVGTELQAAEQNGWQDQLTGEVIVPSVAIIEFDGGRIRTRKTGCGPGVHLESQGWNETKNAIFVSATSEATLTDPEPEPPRCFLDREHVAKLTEHAMIKEKQGSDDRTVDDPTDKNTDDSRKALPHKPKRILRSVVSSMKKSSEFAHQMKREAIRRRFDEATRKAFVADGLTCNWTIHAEHFQDYTPILDFTHAVSYLFTAALVLFNKSEDAWQAYSKWMVATWRGEIDEVLEELLTHQRHIGLSHEETTNEDVREQLRQIIGYLQNNRQRMKYNEYRMHGLPNTSAWMESAVKEVNYRVKGTEMFWNNPEGAETILQIRAAALSDDDRLVRLLTYRAGCSTVRRTASKAAQAA